MAAVHFRCGDDSTSSDIELLSLPHGADGSGTNEIVYKGDSVPIPNNNYLTQTKMAITDCLACAKKQTRLKVVVGLLGITIIVVVACILTLIVTDYSDHLGKLKLNPDSRVMQLSNAKEKPALEVNIGKKIVSKVLRRRAESTYLLYTWEEGVTLKVNKNSENSFTINWKIDTKAPGADQIDSFMDCFVLSSAHWYGGGQVMEQVWPLEKANIQLSSFLPRAANTAEGKNTFGSVIERYWFNSRGAAIFVNESIPLYVSLNNAKDGLCIQVLKKDYPRNKSFQLSYSLFIGNNIKDVHKNVAKRYIQKPSEIPDEIMFQYPLWSTRAKLRGNLTQSSILNFASQIFKIMDLKGLFEIDSYFSSKFGDFDFDPARFSNPGEMINKLHSYGFNVSLRISPFINTDSATFLRDIKYWVKTGDGKVPGLISWDKDMFGAVVDFTNPSACDWFKTKLKNFTKMYNFETFKFGAGEVTYLPYTYSLYRTSNNPGYYATKYAEIAAEFGKSVDVRIGYHTQHLPIFVRIHDRESTWSKGNGLKSIIPAALTFGILGYPFVVPDKIGGNPHNGTKPSKDLFIRWLQLSIFLPAFEFSIPPWEFDQETVVITKNLLQVRKQISPYIIKMAEKVKSTGDPIVRPLWWYAPEDPVAHEIDSAFMLGDDYLVAPVLEKNAIDHVIYLPNGKWEKQFGDNACVDGGQYVTYNNIKLKDIFYFKISKCS